MIIEHWTKLFWINVLWQKYKKSNASNFVIVLNLSYNEDLVTAYLSLCTESPKVQKIGGFLRLMVYMYILYFCAKNILMWLCDFFMTSMIWHKEGSIIHLKSTIILWYFSGFENRRSKLVCSVFQPENFTWGPKWPLKTCFRGQFFRKGANR